MIELVYFANMRALIHTTENQEKPCKSWQQLCYKKTGNQTILGFDYKKENAEVNEVRLIHTSYGPILQLTHPTEDKLTALYW